MFAHTVLRAPDGRDFELGPGDIVGRLDSAALPLADARVSEAHAMVSLREGQLQLLALRGGLAVDGEAVPAVVLLPGLRVQLARGLDLLVVSVHMPDQVVGLDGLGGAPVLLPGVASLLRDPSLRLLRGWRDTAAAWVWSTGAGFALQKRGEAAQPVRVGTSFDLGGQDLRFVWLPSAAAGPTVTRFRADAPLTLVNHFDVVHILREGSGALVLGGKPARLLGELAAIRSPVAWLDVARLLWPEDEDDSYTLRTRFDVLLGRLRRKLRDAGIRPDLLATDGTGKVSLVLGERDRVEDRA